MADCPADPIVEVYKEMAFLTLKRNLCGRKNTLTLSMVQGTPVILTQEEEAGGLEVQSNPWPSKQVETSLGDLRHCVEAEQGGAAQWTWSLINRQLPFVPKPFVSTTRKGKQTVRVK